MRRMKNGVVIVAIIFAACTVRMEAQRKTVKKKTEPVDFSVLTAFKGALLDLKGAVEVGVNREDYQRKLQTATGISLKTEDQVSGDNDSVQLCFLAYKNALSSYKFAAVRFDFLIASRASLLRAQASLDEAEHDYNYLPLSGRSERVDSAEAQVSEAEATLQAKWSNADRELDAAIVCSKTKVN